MIAILWRLRSLYLSEQAEEVPHKGRKLTQKTIVRTQEPVKAEQCLHSRSDLPRGEGHISVPRRSGIHKWRCWRRMDPYVRKS